MPKENLEGALQDFESQLQEYNLPADKTQEVDDPTSNTHFAISDAARLNIVALRLCLGFWNVFLATGENAAHNLEGCGRFQEEAQEAYKAAAQVCPAPPPPPHPRDCQRQLQAPALGAAALSSRH
mmetsp:Transcript_24075/g.60521  ORF Transcript_24075/g.60521 Transcript_24075/m.60521 type:complete len:125 (+) Transcript_24075:1398-1772(+)